MVMQSSHTVITASITNTYSHYATCPANHVIHFILWCLGVSMNCHAHLSPQSRVTEYESLPCIQHEGIWRNGGIDPLILNRCTRWRWVVSFTHQTRLHPQPLHRRLGGIQSCSHILEKRKNISPLLSTEPCFLNCSAHGQVTIHTELS